MLASTAFIGAYGYGNLGDELCLIEAMQEFPATKAYAYSVDPAWTRRCVAVDGTFNTLAELMSLGVERVVYGGGGIGTLPGLDIFTGWMRQLQKRGAACYFHNIGVAKLADLSWLDAERQRFSMISRDLRSETTLRSKSWR